MLSIEVARFRARTLAALRAFFDERGYLEVDTPILAPELIPEAHIEPFATDLLDPCDPGIAERRFLVPSPEVWMKRLLARGYGNIYYLGKVFRNSESRSRIHHPEFTMLEWYTVEADAESQEDLTARLLAHLCARLCERTPHTEGCRTVGAPVERLTVAGSFARYAGLDGFRFDAPGSLRRAAAQLGLRVGPQESDEDLFQRILLTHVEPALPTDRPVILADYPALVPTLARAHGATCERWELYLAGMEIANCYTEERDPSRLAEFLSHEAARKRDARVRHPPAESLLEFASAPACSGAALGVDRLIMALLGLREIAGVIFFP